MSGSDMRWWRCTCSKQGWQVSAAHVFLCANVRKELSKARLCIQSRCEEEGTRAIMIFAELRIRTALLQEDRHHMEGILCEGLLIAKGPRRKDQDIIARGEDLRDEWRVDPRFGRRGMAHHGVPVPTQGHKRVDARLDSLRQRQHDAPVMWRNASTYLLPSKKTGYSRGPQNEVRKLTQKPVARRGASPVRENAKLSARSSVATKQKGHRHGQARRSPLRDLLAETVFGKRAGSKNTTPPGPHFGVRISDPKMGSVVIKDCDVAPVLGVQILDPKTGADKRCFSRGSSVPVQYAQTCPSTLVDTGKRYLL